jgi:hypothetical protein
MSNIVYRCNNRVTHGDWDQWAEHVTGNISPQQRAFNFPSDNKKDGTVAHLRITDNDEGVDDCRLRLWPMGHGLHSHLEAKTPTDFSISAQIRSKNLLKLEP